MVFVLFSGDLLIFFVVTKLNFIAEIIVGKYKRNDRSYTF